MENLMINGTNNFNLEGMTDEQLEIVTSKALLIRQKNADAKIAELANKQAKLEEITKINEGKLDEAVNELEKTKKFIDVLGFAVNSYKLEILKSKAVARVYSLFNNDVTSIEFIVWSPYFFHKIYSDIAHYFEVNKCANIHVDNFGEACSVAENWKPSEDYICKKIEEMKKKVLNGTLKQERVMALNMYLKATNDGEINPFC